MQEYRNDLIDDYMWWELQKIKADFSGYCKAIGVKTEKMDVKNYQCKGGRFCYLEKNEESGIILWWGCKDEGQAYILPDSVSVDMETGLITSDSDFTVSEILEE